MNQPVVVAFDHFDDARSATCVSSSVQAQVRFEDTAIVPRVVDVVSRAVASGGLPESRVNEAWERVQHLFA